VNKPPAFQVYARDWIVDTARLTLEEEGAVARMKAHQWIEGPLPNDPAELSRILGLTRARFRRVWGKIGRFFPVIEEGRVANPELEAQRAELLAFKAGQQNRGRIGAVKRWHGDGMAPPMATPLPEHSGEHGEGYGEPHGESMALQSASAPAPAESQKQKPPYTPEFEIAWAAYPRREGGNPKGDAFRAWSARIAEGESPETLVAGVERYARFCTAKGKIGTEFVQQTATFFGRKKSYLESWDFSATAPPDPHVGLPGESGPAMIDRILGVRTIVDG
jgi:uncharacterized protein YdaU (DUF1376 family)